jgi:hypothetical protein
VFCDRLKKSWNQDSYRRIKVRRFGHVSDSQIMDELKYYRKSDGLMRVVKKNI